MIMNKNNKSKAGQAVEEHTEGETRRIKAARGHGAPAVNTTGWNYGNSGYIYTHIYLYEVVFRAIGSLTGNFPVLSYSLKVSTTVPSSPVDPANA